MMALAEIFQSHKAVNPVFVSLGKSTTPGTSKKEQRKTEKGTKKLEADESLETTSPMKKLGTNDVGGRTSKHETRRKTKSELEADAEKNKRTIFLGNLPPTCSKKQLMKLFCQYGKIESVRFRCARSGTLLPKRIAVKRGLSGTETSSQEEVVAYIVFSSEESVTKSLEANGTLLDGRHIRVDGASGSTQHKHSHSIFVGNLPFTITSEQLRETFRQYGEIDGVRVIRDQKTGIGKGFGFVLFKEKSGIMFALKNAKNTKLDGRTLRVFKSSENPQKVIKKKKGPMKKKHDFGSKSRRDKKLGSGTKPRKDINSNAKKFHKPTYKKGKKQ